jgi:shikimate kinase
VAEAATLKLTAPVVLVGMMGAGKTAVGGAVAAQLGVPFIDSDHEIEQAANAKIAEIFERDGEAFFRDRETEVLARLLGGVPAILSTGGGAFLAERNRALIAEKGVSVWLDAELELLWSRVRHKSTRPLLLTDNPKATLAEIYAQRVPVYAKAALHVKAAPELSIDQMASRVIAALRAHPGLMAES